MAIAKLPITEKKLKGKKRWHDDHKTWTSHDWKHIIWSNKLSVTLFPISHQVYVWRRPKETYTPEYLVPTVKHADGSVTIWVPISRYSTGPIITLNG